jgi:hypothetical protein
MIKVRCILCLEKKLEGKSNDEIIKLEQSTQYNIFSPNIAKDDIQAMQDLGQQLVAHLQANHPEELQKLALLQVHWNGFNVMKLFESNEDNIFEQQKEEMRDKLIEEVMGFAPEGEEEEEEESKVTIELLPVE